MTAIAKNLKTYKTKTYLWPSPLPFIVGRGVRVESHLLDGLLIVTKNEVVNVDLLSLTLGSHDRNHVLDKFRHPLIDLDVDIGHDAFNETLVPVGNIHLGTERPKLRVVHTRIAQKDISIGELLEGSGISKAMMID